MLGSRLGPRWLAQQAKLVIGMGITTPYVANLAIPRAGLDGWAWIVLRVIRSRFPEETYQCPIHDGRRNETGLTGQLHARAVAVAGVEPHATLQLALKETGR